MTEKQWEKVLEQSWREASKHAETPIAKAIGEVVADAGKKQWSDKGCHVSLSAIEELMRLAGITRKEQGNGDDQG